jgi:hypothetical protein
MRSISLGVLPARTGFWFCKGMPRDSGSLATRGIPFFDVAREAFALTASFLAAEAEVSSITRAKDEPFAGLEERRALLFSGLEPLFSNFMGECAIVLSSRRYSASCDKQRKCQNPQVAASQELSGFDICFAGLASALWLFFRPANGQNTDLALIIVLQ